MGVGLGAGVGKAKNELVSDTNSFLPGGRVWPRQIPRPFWLKVHAAPRAYPKGPKTSGNLKM